MKARDIFAKGWPFLVIRVKGRIPEIEERIRSLYHKRMTLREFLEELRKLSGHRVYCSTTFTPDRFYDYHEWSYKWPQETLEEEMPSVELEVLPPGRVPLEKWWAYTGFAIVAESERKVEVPGGLLEPMKVKVIGFAVTKTPRRLVILSLERRGGRYYIEVYTAIPEIRRALIKIGMRPETEYKLVKAFDSEVDALEFLREKVEPTLGRFKVLSLMTHHVKELVQRLKTM